jgi:hypothetical protein
MIAANNQRKSPFKFLDPYGKDDISFFFGREGEIEKLYQSVNKNRIVLVYGLSGTGKTSLVQCGLADRFDVTDWIPFFVRRGANLNTSLREALIKSKVVGGDTEELKHPKAVVEYLKLISKRYLRSVFLIFDQFEELLILGDDEEKTEFIKTLWQIIVSDDTQFCNFIFILREEYFAQLELFEEVIPGFSDRRMRVEHMRPTQVSEVITKSCKYFNIKFENEEENVKEILHRLTEKSGIHLPYLQIYLDQLWREDFLRSYPNGFPEKGFPPLEFTTQEIQSFGDIRDVTRRFLTERMKSIQQDLKTDFPGIADNTLNNILDAFVTDRGTKMPIPFTWKDDERIFPDSVPRILRQTDRKLLECCIQELEYNRVLRQDASSMELAHDNIADFIYQQRTVERIKLDEIERQIVTHFDEYRQTKEYLSKKQVMMYEDAIPQLDLNDAQIKYFRDSKRYHDRKSIFRVGLWVLALLVIFYIFHAFQTSRLSDSQFASLYLGFRLDAIPNKFDALRVAKYIYDKDVVSSNDQALFRDKFVKVFQSKEIQASFSNYKKIFNKTIFNPESFDISTDGSYYVIDTSLAPGKKQFVLYSTLQNAAITSFENVEYVYFVNRPNILLVARSVPVYIEGQLITLNYPNEFILYDCKNRDTIPIWYGMGSKKECALHTDRLYSLDDISKVKSEFDSYRVRFTNSDNLVIPFMEKVGENGFEPKVKLLADHRLHTKLESSSTISLSKNGQLLMTGTEKAGVPIIQVYLENGKLVDTISNVYFGDFTKSSSIIYIRKGSLVIMDPSGDTNSCWVDAKIDYAFADEENQMAIARSKDKVFLVDMKNKTVKLYNDTLVGIDFTRRTFITQPKGNSKADSLIQRDFSGKVLHTFSRREPFKEVISNANSGELLILTKSLQLIWLSEELQVHSGFQLTANDLYGFSGDGNIMYFIRDDYLTFFKDESHIIDLSDFNAAYAWLNNTYGPERLHLRKGERDTFQLHFPSDNLLWRFKD